MARLIASMLFLALTLGCGMTPRVKIAGYPSVEVPEEPGKACKNGEFENVRVLAAMPEEGKYTEVGFMQVSQSTGTDYTDTSDEKQFKAARIRACEWGADAIVVMGDPVIHYSSGNFPRPEEKHHTNRFMAIRFKPGG